MLDRQSCNIYPNSSRLLYNFIDNLFIVKVTLSPDQAEELRQNLQVLVLQALVAARRWEPGDLIFQDGTSLHLARWLPSYWPLSAATVGAMTASAVAALRHGMDEMGILLPKIDVPVGA